MQRLSKRICQDLREKDEIEHLTDTSFELFADDLLLHAEKM